MASPLGRLFGKSPIAPIQQHMQFAQEAVQLLCEAITATADGNRERAAEILALVETSVAGARALRHDVREHLPRGLLLAVPRADLLALIELQQGILSHVEAVLRPLAARGIQIDDGVRVAMDRLSSRLADAADKALAAIRELDEMLELAFSNRERGPVHEALDALREQLSLFDEEKQQLLMEIAAREASLAPVDAVLLYRCAEALGEVAGGCRDVGDQLDLLLAR